MRTSLCLTTALGLMVMPLSASGQTAVNDRGAEQQAAIADQGRFLTPSSFSTLAKAKLPAVVSIITTQQQEEAMPGAERMPPGMEDFMRRFGPPQDRPGGPPPPARNALGSGFIIDAEGYVVTNNHVVEGAESVDVVLEDGRKLPAEVVGTDPRTDLAVLKVEADEPLPQLDWGGSDEIEIGDWVMAIGNPFGLGGTVTTGVISARARDLGAGPYDDYLQTDASINRGNSGGPLIDMQGRVVGVNTAIFSPTGGSVGIGFAVPSSIAQDVARQLRETGDVRRGWLGVQIQPVNEAIAGSLGLEQPEGALVADVTAGSPAAEAGVQVGDVILQFGGEAIEGPRDLTLAVATAPLGKESPMTVWRDGQKTTLNPQIALLADDEGLDPAAPAADAEGGLGLALSPLTPEQRRRFGIAEDVQGALVADVAPGSPAFEQGIMPGDVITRIGGATVEGPQDVVDAVEAARKEDKESILVLRQREDGKSFVALPLDAGPG